MLGALSAKEFISGFRGLAFAFEPLGYEGYGQPISEGAFLDAKGFVIMDETFQTRPYILLMASPEAVWWPSGDSSDVTSATLLQFRPIRQQFGFKDVLAH